jgi:hypothetical protein
MNKHSPYILVRSIEPVTITGIGTSGFVSGINYFKIFQSFHPLFSNHIERTSIYSFLHLSSFVPKLEDPFYRKNSEEGLPLEAEHKEKAMRAAMLGRFRHFVTENHGPY